MSYMEQTCPHSGAFGYRAPKKGRNLSWFVELALGALVLFGIFAGIVMIGGCLGCEVCFECAAACDEEMGCGLEECARDCNAQSDDCVSCEGVDCFGREGCFACDGKWDCSECSGEVYYKVELISGEVTTPLKFKGGTNRVTVHAYNDDRPQNYFTFKGYFDKKVGGTKYIDEAGNVIKKITKDIKLYAQYTEVNENDEYNLVFHTENTVDGGYYFQLDAMSAETVVNVGYDTASFPEYAELEGYVFKGWYTDEEGRGKLIWGPETTSYTVHLSDFGKHPLDQDKILHVYAYYTYLTYEVKFNYANGNSRTEQVRAGTTFAELKQLVGNSGEEYKYFGWSYYPNANENNVITDETTITGALEVYEVARLYYTIKFYYKQTDYYGWQVYEVKLYEGQKFTFEEDSTILNIKTNAGVYKGFTFARWTTDESGMSASKTEITYMSAQVAKTYYAQYDEATYNISYIIPAKYAGMAIDMTNDAKIAGANTQYKYSPNTSVALWRCDDIFGTFIGWCEDPDGYGTIYSLSDGCQLWAGAYGHKILYAVFR